MTDREQIEAILNGAGVVFEDQGSDLRITASGGKANKGYPFFFTDFEFDDDGKLLAVGAWE